ncbi:hypothetical protein BOTBODRAFT_369918 [Botryobasidium botryosum FD-172 SS1]|uniref:Uncharacterized protein n=1 Tax=Botryobasidium botryosum (strain FD-172 SS1) TaxID=930990 RepID=A0A067MFN3_BOTB1|nr:hypothetical protein BOTBODRAFT_369918 [Botryobasidium botryosum FD-172 SS1]
MVHGGERAGARRRAVGHQNFRPLLWSRSCGQTRGTSFVLCAFVVYYAFNPLGQLMHRVFHGLDAVSFQTKIPFIHLRVTSCFID